MCFSFIPIWSLLQSIEKGSFAQFISALKDRVFLCHCDKIKQYAQKGERAPYYFYRSSNGLEIDLLMDRGDHLNVYEIKFSASPNKNMIGPLSAIKKELPVKHAELLNLRREKVPFSGGIIAKHWNA